MHCHSRFAFLIAVLFVHSFTSSASQIADAQSFSLSAKALLDEANTGSTEKTSDAIVSLDEDHWSFRADGSILRVQHVVYQVLTSNGVEGWSAIEQRWEPWHEQRPSIRARVIGADGVVHELDQKTIIDGPAGMNEPDSYSDVRVVKCPLPGVQPGAVVEEEIRWDFKPVLNSELVRSYFGRPVPVRVTRLAIDYPEALPLRYTAYLLPDLKTSRQAADGMVHLTFEAGPSEPLSPALPLIPSDVPRWPSIVFSTADSWTGLAHAYSEIVDRQIAEAPVRELVQKALSSAQGSDTRTRVATLIRALHAQVRYTGVEFGEAAIVPARPADTLSRKYGDCKDKAALLVAMLRAANITSYVALLSSGFDQDVDPRHPGMGLFDHAIVFVPGSPDLWIDATATHLEAGALPAGDQGRLALVIRPETTELIKIPDSPSTGNLTIETREFFLPDFGGARVVETSEGKGNADASLRQNYGFADTEQVTKNLREYMQSAYGSEAAVKVEHSKADDYAHPFRLRLETSEAKAAPVSETDAFVLISNPSLFANLPRFFFMEDPKHPDPKEAHRIEERTEDFILPEAYAIEWHYRIALPAGFQLKKFPDNETLEMGPARYSASYRMEKGVALADLRFDTVKRRYTKAEAGQLRKAILDIARRPLAVASFEPLGQSYLQQGKIREAIAQFSSMTKEYPDQPVYHVQISRALLAAGCGEQARVEARRATTMEPNSLVAWQNLGFTLMHDLIGRQFKKGWDPAGVEQALRKAMAIDPKNMLSPRNLAVSFEYGANGIRYADTKRLAAAIEVLHGMGDENLAGQNLLDSLLFDLVYAAKYDELQTRLQKLPMEPANLGLRLFATAVRSGSQAAITEASGSTSDPAVRSSAFQTATQLLLLSGKYSDAADLMAASAQGAPDGAQFAARASVLKNVKHYDPKTLKADSPAGLANTFLAAFAADRDSIYGLLASEETAGQSKEEFLSGLQQGMRARSGMGPDANLPASVLTDLMLSMAHVTVDQNGADTYRVRLTVPGANQQTVYAVREQNQFRMLLGRNQATGGVGRRILAELDHGHPEIARKWLDWVREEIRIQGGDDPLEGPVFPRVWTKGSQAGENVMRYAAATLAADKPSLPILKENIVSASDPAGKAFAELAYVRASFSARQWKEALPVAQSLYESHSDSDTALGTLVAMEAGLKEWKKAEDLIRDRLKKDPDNPVGKRMLANAIAEQGRFSDAESVYKEIAESARGIPYDWNSFGWMALFAGDLKGDQIDSVQRSTSSNQNDPALLHTLASMLAEAGKPSEAREVILQAMTAWGIDEPNQESWYVFGRIAEDHGLNDAAAAYYTRLEPPKNGTPDPLSTYILAQKRLAILKRTSS